MLFLFLLFILYPIFLLISKIINNELFKIIITWIIWFSLTSLSFYTWCSDDWISSNIWRRWACSHHWWVETNINEYWIILLIIIMIIYIILFILNNKKIKQKQINDMKMEKELIIINFVKDKYFKKLKEFNYNIAIKRWLEHSRKKNLIEKTIKLKKRFKFNYINNKWIKSTRIIKPQSTNQYKWTVYWFCFSRGEKRYFKIFKISDIEILD